MKPSNEQMTGPERAALAQKLKDMGLPPGKVPEFTGKSRKECADAIKQVVRIKH